VVWPRKQSFLNVTVGFPLFNDGLTAAGKVFQGLTVFVIYAWRLFGRDFQGGTLRLHGIAQKPAAG
jgi:hypothetical protein